MLPSRENLLQRNQERKQAIISSGRTPKQADDILEERSLYVREFIMANFQLLEPTDQTLLEKTAKKLFRINMLCFIPACFGNIFLSQITNQKIWQYGVYTRVGIRSLIFLLPMSWSFYNSYYTTSTLLLHMEDKYGDRVGKFLKTGDPRTINPDY